MRDVWGCNKCVWTSSAGFSLFPIKCALREPCTDPAQGRVKRCHNFFFKFFLKVFFDGHIHMSYFGATGTPVLDFWWRLLWVSKPEWVLPYSHCEGKCNVHFLRSTSGATCCRPLDGQHYGAPTRFISCPRILLCGTSEFEYFIMYTLTESEIKTQQTYEIEDHYSHITIYFGWKQRVWQKSEDESGHMCWHQHYAYQCIPDDISWPTMQKTVTHRHPSHSNDSVLQLVGRCKLHMLHPNTWQKLATTFYITHDEGSVLVSCATSLELELITIKARLNEVPKHIPIYTSALDTPQHTDPYRVNTVAISVSNQSSKISPCLVWNPIQVNAFPNHLMSVLWKHPRDSYFLISLISIKPHYQAIRYYIMCSG